MKFFGKTLLAFFISLMMAGCVKNEFKIEFQFPKEYIGNYLVTYYARDARGGWWMEQTAAVQDGIAIVDGITRLPTIVYITDASSNTNSMAIYVERGDKIKISGDGSDMAEWTVSGNKTTERWCEWRKASKAAKADPKSLEKSISQYVKDNPSDKLSAILLLTEWNRRENPEGFLKLWNSIDKDVRSQDLAEMCGSTDLLGVEFSTDANGNLAAAKDPKLKTMVVRSLDNGVDTLKFTKVKASLIYLYSDNNSERMETADTLKSLSKAYPDSMKRVIADISVDTDSMAWVGSIRRDSIKGIVRGWQPKGIAEEDMVKLGITRLPWFIVKDKNAKESYSGSDLKAATSMFRKEMEKQEKKESKDTKAKPKPSKPKPKTTSKSTK